MEVGRLCLAAALLLAVSSTGRADTASFEKEMEMLAPTVTAACCNEAAGCDQSCGSICDSAGCCDSLGCCGVGCDGGCDSGCGCGSRRGCRDSLLGHGIIKRSDRCFDDFISPMSNPVFFEDPRSLTEARFIFLHHKLPSSLGGNSVQLYALQLRARLTERLSLIATKDGLIYTRSPILDDGLADLSAGLKYNLYRDTRKGRLLSTGFTFEAASGSRRTLQGNGNGEFNFFVSGGTRIGDRGHFISATGLREPIDRNLENRVWYWSNHLDFQVTDRPIYLFTEINWWHYLSSATAFGLPVEGGDLFNLGSPNITGNDLVTQAVGMKVKPRRNIEAGFAYEFPLTARKGLMENRINADLIFRF